MAKAFDELQAQLWVLAALGRLAGAGLLTRPAENAVDTAAQTLLLEAGWLDADPFGPSPQLLEALPPGAPVKMTEGFTSELLGVTSRFVNGASPGWAETNPALIRWRGRGSGQLVVNTLFEKCWASVPGVRERLTEAGAAFLDVGVGAGGVALAMCRAYPQLRVVGLDVNPLALTVAREDIAAAGLQGRIEIRDQSVADLHDELCYDLIWVPQVFIPADVLAAALPRLRVALRAGGAIVLGLSGNTDSGVVGAASELACLMTGGGTMSGTAAAQLMQRAGFRNVSVIEVATGTVVTATG